MSDPEVTQFGFNWEAAKVERITELPRGSTAAAGSHVGVVIGIGIVGKKGSVIDVYVSPTGQRIRAFRGGKELK